MNSLPEGAVIDPAPLDAVLAGCWDDFEGGGAEDMKGFKLRGRMREVRWDPPVLQFVIERHGATVHGSSRAERQQWTLDLTRQTAQSERVGFLQVRPMQPPLDVRPLVEEIASLIRNKAVDDRLAWSQDGSVRVHIGKIIPDGSVAKQTLGSRRKRFRGALTRSLAQAGWRCIRTNVYQPADSRHVCGTGGR